MIYATRIRMMQNYLGASAYHTIEGQLLEIDEIFLTTSDWSGWFKKNSVHDFVKSGTDVCVNVSQNPKLFAAMSKNNEKYVRSSPNDSTHDNLLDLPQG